MNTGEYLLSKSSLESGTAFAHLLNIRSGGTGVVINDAIDFVLEDAEMVLYLEDSAILVELEDVPIALEVGQDDFALDTEPVLEMIND